MGLLDFESVKLTFREFFITIKLITEKMDSLDKIFHLYGKDVQTMLSPTERYLDYVNLELHHFLRGFEDQWRQLQLKIVKTVLAAIPEKGGVRKEFKRAVKAEDRKISSKYHQILLTNFKDGSEAVFEELKVFGEIITSADGLKGRRGGFGSREAGDSGLMGGCAGDEVILMSAARGRGGPKNAKNEGGLGDGWERGAGKGLSPLDMMEALDFRLSYQLQASDCKTSKIQKIHKNLRKTAHSSPYESSFLPHSFIPRHRSSQIAKKSHFLKPKKTSIFAKKIN